MAQNSAKGMEWLRDYPLTELADCLTTEQVRIIDAYQANADMAALLSDPIPLALSDTNETGARALKNNTSFYEPDIEDLISGDLIVERLLGNNTEARTPALRARRTIIALAFEWNIDLTSDGRPAIPEQTPESENIEINQSTAA
ncbi:MAG TPA: hypothetical protein VK694_06265 [Verrucomicrobiae bacterium]|nr:hypothetical protein [Verrucomicrobiae bacterium]